VLIHAWGDAWMLQRFIDSLSAECPPLARIDAIERHQLNEAAEANDFRIVPSVSGHVQTGVTPDAVVCADCAAEIADPANRRYRYPFTNCTHCGRSYKPFPTIAPIPQWRRSSCATRVARNTTIRPTGAFTRNRLRAPHAARVSGWRAVTARA
jgi:hydrogenase maturation factor HypF (carbamoyltransferase family)